MKRTQCILFIILFLLSLNRISFAQGNIVDYFLKNPKAWDKTKKLIHKEPIKIIITVDWMDWVLTLQN